ncbi:MAG: flagellar motor stator protein MotA [Bryobacteraceae bacterium]|jgi:chemotaxis protein MotA
MLALLGIAVVLLAVFGGFLLERGNPYVLMQPAELLIVGGAAIGIVVVANPPDVMRKMARGAFAAFRPPVHTCHSFLRYLRMLYEVFGFVQRAGIVDLENDVENPATSRIFRNYPEFLADQPTRDFVCDSLRMLVIGVTTPHELDQLMDLDIEVQRQGRHEPVNGLSTVADALPGLGIVAAVLGVVITMEAIGGAPETVGEKIAAALVGTFLGIFGCYGVVGPVAARMENMSGTETQFLQVLRIAIVAFARGSSPILAVEYARRSIPAELRPSFLEMEITIKRDARIPAVPKPGIPEAVPIPAAPKPSVPETAHVEVQPA